LLFDDITFATLEGSLLSRDKNQNKKSESKKTPGYDLITNQIGDAEAAKNGNQIHYPTI
jgi:hypothetical protein